MRSILVTAGPTREKIDPVRFLSNYSTGKFGYEIAREAKRRGWRATLVSGPTYLEVPRGVRLVRVESAMDMKKAVMKELAGTDCLVMAAAVSDWRPKSFSKTKIKKRGGKRVLELAQNPDILSAAGRKKGAKVLVGFALETENLEKNAYRKLKEKNLDIIIANRLTRDACAFGDCPTDILMLDRFGNKSELRRRSKGRLAKIILDKVETFNI